MLELAKWEIESPLDMHVHFRSGKILRAVAPYTAKHFSGALVMPNLVPPVDTLDSVKSYEEEIQRATEAYNFKPFMTLFFKITLTKEIFRTAKEHILAVKMYPQGITTNSASGVDPRGNDVEEVLKILQDLEIPLCIHGEDDSFVMDREVSFYQYYLRKWVQRYPKLKIIMEHITDRRILPLLQEFENVYATVTVHHLLLTLDDVVGGMMQPHHFCKPIAKTRLDRNALRRAVFNQAGTILSRKIMLGTDSAPHPVSKKECCGCAAGIFSAPVALQVLAEEFYQNSTIEQFQRFVSENAQRIYGITPHTLTPYAKKITLERGKDSVVPQGLWLADGTEILKGSMRIPDVAVQYFMAGETLKWSYVES